MPELPEVETVRLGLLPYTTGKTIKSVTLHRANLRGVIPPDLPKCTENQRITALERHGKTMFWQLENGVRLAWHLGMSGSFRAVHMGIPAPKPHDHVVIAMDDGDTLVFNDPRRFGSLTYAKEALAGIDPFSKAYTWTAFQKLFANRKTPVKSALLDQTLITGIGNIYACEALFESHIHPTRLVKDIEQDKLKALFKAIKDVLKRAIASGGSSLRDHVMVNGEAGKFQHSFFVYGRKNQPCRVCQTPIETIRQSGRTTFFCPSCQRL